MNYQIMSIFFFAGDKAQATFASIVKVITQFLNMLAILYYHLVKTCPHFFFKLFYVMKR